MLALGTAIPRQFTLVTEMEFVVVSRTNRTEIALAIRNVARVDDLFGHFGRLNDFDTTSVNLFNRCLDAFLHISAR